MYGFHLLKWKIENPLKSKKSASRTWRHFENRSALKGFRSVSISYSTTPKEKMSLRASTVLPEACSGDMYPIVPITVCAPVAILSLRSDRPVPSRQAWLGCTTIFIGHKTRFLLTCELNE